MLSLAFGVPFSRKYVDLLFFLFCQVTLSDTLTKIRTLRLPYLLDDVVVWHDGIVITPSRLFRYTSTHVIRFIRGLALEAMFTLLTLKFIPFFLVLWIISELLQRFNIV